MTHPMRENGALADTSQLHELTGLMADGRVTHADLEEFLKKYRGATEYERNFEAVVAPVRVKLDGFDSGINGKNFPGQELGPTEYRVSPKVLLPKPDGYSFAEVQTVVAGWVRDKLIAGCATVIETLRYAGEKRGDQENYAWIVCVEAVSVDGEALCLYRDDAGRIACLRSCSIGWDGGGFVLVREVLLTQP